MSARDDMVFRPNLGPLRSPTVRARAKEARAMQLATSRRGPLTTLGRAAAVKTARNRLARRVATRTGAKAVTTGVTRGLASRAASAAGRTPWGLIIGALVVVGVVGLRLASGKPLEGTAAELNKMFLGDLDDQARAKMATRDGLDPLLLSYVQSKGEIGETASKIASFAYEQELKRQKGRSLIEEALPVNSTLDILILQVRDAFLKYWKKLGLDEDFAVVKNLLRLKRAAKTAFAPLDWFGISVALGKAIVSR